MQVTKCLVAVLVATAGQVHGGMISTLSSWDGSTFVQEFGETDTATYGQTFTVVGPDTVLDSYSFFINDKVNPDFIDFAGYIMAWDGIKATGPVLFASNMMSTTNNGGAGGFEQFTVSTGGLDLNAGEKYVAFFSASNFFDGQVGSGTLGLTSSDSYTGGEFVFQNNGSNFALLTSRGWASYPFRDLAFEMSFSAPNAVPEPSSLALFSLGAVGMAFVAARRRRERRTLAS